MATEPASFSPEPPPIGTAVDAFHNLFTAGPTPEPPEPPGYDLRPLTWAAVILHGGQRNGTFTNTAFSEIVRIKFDLKDAPDEKWCRDVLRKLPYLTAYPGGFWRTQTG